MKRKEKNTKEDMEKRNEEIVRRIREESTKIERGRRKEEECEGVNKKR